MGCSLIKKVKTMKTRLSDDVPKDILVDIAYYSLLDVNVLEKVRERVKYNKFNTGLFKDGYFKNIKEVDDAIKGLQRRNIGKKPTKTQQKAIDTLMFFIENRNDRNTVLNRNYQQMLTDVYTDIDSININKGSKIVGNPTYETEDIYVLRMGEEFENEFEKLFTADAESGLIPFALDDSFIEHVSTVVNTIQEFWKLAAPNYTIKYKEGKTTDAGSYGYYTDTSLVDGKDTVNNQDEIGIYINEEDKSIAKSEIFLHESLHSIARRVKEIYPETFDKLEKLRNSMIDDNVFTHEYFLQSIQAVKGTNEFTDKEIEIAKERAAYIFTKGADIEEFFAYGLSNAVLFQILQGYEISKKDNNEENVDSLFKIFIDTLKSIFNTILGRREESTKALDIFNETLEDVMKMQVRVINNSKSNLIDNSTIEEFAYVKNVITLANTVFKTSSEAIQYFRDVIGIPINNVIKKALELMFSLKDKFLNLSKVTLNEIFKYLSEIWGIKQMLHSGVIQSIYTSLVEDTATGKYSSLYTMFRQSLDTINKVSKDTKESIIRRMRENSVILNDLELNASISREFVKTGVIYSLENILKEVVNGKSVDTQIEDIIKKIPSKFRSKIEDRARKLAKFSLNNKGDISSPSLSMLGMSKYLDIKDKDRLVSLYIIKEQGNEDNITTFAEHEEYFNELSELSRMMNHVVYKVDKYGKSLRDTIKFNYYRQDTDAIDKYKIILVNKKELPKYDKNIIIPINDGTSFKFYNKEYVLAKVKDTDINKTEGLLRTSGSLLDDNTISVKEVLYTAIKENSPDLDEKMVVELLTRLLPRMLKKYSEQVSGRYDNKGELIDVVVDISTDIKESYLNEGVYLEEIIPVTVSNIKRNTSNIDIMNRKVVDTLESIYRKHKDDKSIKFIHIGKKSKDPRAFMIYNRFGSNIKRIIDNQGGSIPIPEDMLDIVVGYDDLSISNSKFLSGKIRSKTVIRLAEQIVTEILTFFKGQLIRFNPNIFVGNTISNMLIAMSYGISPIEYYRQFKSYWRLLEEYIKTNKELRYYQTLYASGDLSVKPKITVLKNVLHSNKFHTLVSDGQFTPMLEELDEVDNKLLSSGIGKIANRYSDNVDKRSKLIYKELRRKAIINPNMDLEKEYRRVLEDDEDKFKIPAKMSDVVHFIYGTGNSYSDRLATKFIQYGDTITRQIVFDKVTKERRKQLKGKTIPSEEIQVLLNQLDKIFINYGYNENKYMSYANKTGGLFFMKYLLQSQKGYLEVFKKNPINVITQQMAQAGTGIDLADPLDTFIGKDLIDLIANREQLDNFGEVLVDSVTPNVFMPITEFSLDTIYK